MVWRRPTFLRRRCRITHPWIEFRPIQPPRLNADAELIAHLEGAGRAIDCGEGVVLSRDAFDAARASIERLIRERGATTLADARDALATNRRTAQALLETLDRLGVTRRQGDERVLV